MTRDEFLNLPVEPKPRVNNQPFLTKGLDDQLEQVRNDPSVNQVFYAIQKVTDGESGFSGLTIEIVSCTLDDTSINTCELVIADELKTFVKENQK